MIVYVGLNEDNRVAVIGTTPVGENPIEVEVESLSHPVFEDPLRYKYIDGELVLDSSNDLDRAKAFKDIELNQACNDSILGGFDHTVNGETYHFSFDTEAQLNFQGIRPLLSEGMISQVDWTVTKGDTYHRIPVDKKLMDELTVAILMHKDGNVRKYRNVLLPKVYEATTVEEVNSINWDSV